MRALRIAGVAIGGLLAILTLMFAVLQTPPGQRVLAGIISGAASTPDGGLEVSGVDGFFPTDMQVARIAYRDRQGPWLTAENVRLRWSFASLFGGRLRVEDLSADRIEVLRPPLPSKDESTSGGGGFRLPVGIDLQVLSIGDLHLAAALAGIDSRWKVAGSALLPADLKEGRLVLNGGRLDGPEGRLATDIRFDLERGTIDGEISLTEKRGGVVAVLIERPDIEDLSMRLVARGEAKAGKAELTVSAGDAARATGTAAWEPKGTATALSVRLDAAGPGLPKGRLTDVARGPIALIVQGTLDDKLLTVSEAKLTAGSLELQATARYDRAADRLDATGTVLADQPGALAALAGGVTWRGLRVQAKADLAGLSRKPQGTVTLSGAAAELSLEALDGRLPMISNATIETSLKMVDGAINVTSLDIGSSLASIKGSGVYWLSTKAGELKATVALPNLEPLSALAGRQLGGSATVDLTATADAQGLKANWQGTVTDISATGLPTEVATARVSLSGSAAWRYDETWSLTDVRVASDGGTLVISGRGRDSTGDLELSLDLPKLALLQSELAGAAKVRSTIRLRTDGTDLRVTAELEGLKHQQLASRQLTLSASASLDASGAVRGEIAANGDLVDQALSLEGRFERDAAGGVTVPTFQGKWASAVLDVADLAITQARTSGRATLRIARLQDASPLAGTDLAGSIDAEVTADAQAPKGQVVVQVRGSDLRSGSFAIGALDLRSTIDDPVTTAMTDTTVTASRIAGAADISALKATATGDRQSLVVALQASGSRTNASLAAKVDLAGEVLVIGLTRFEGRHAGIPVSLTAPTRFRIAGSRVSIEPTNLRVGGGQLRASGTLAPTGSDLSLDLAALPLSLIDAVAPGTNLDGTLQAKLRVTGALDAPSIDATYSAAGLRLRKPEAALLPPLSLQGSGKLMGRQASIDARLGMGGATNLSLKGKAALPSGRAPLSGSASVNGTIDAAPFAPLLGNEIRNVAGTLRPDLTIEFGQRITGSGTIDFSNGRVSLPESGMRLSNGEGRFVLQGDAVQIQRLSFQTGRGGSVTASGTMRLDTQQGLVPDLGITSRNALLVSRPDLVASVSSNLKLTGSTTGGITLSGPITIDRAEILVGGQQSADYPTLDVREVNKPGAPKSTQRVAANRPAARTQPPPGATPLRLALSIRAPQAIFVRGRGLDAEMSGQVEVGGAPAAPTVTGGLTLRRGDFNLAGRRLTFSRGVVTLDNLDSIDPRLDFVASVTVQSTTVNVTIGGTSRAPTIAISSIPSLPPDEAMALLLFGKPASGLSAFEMAQAAQGLAELTGRSPESGMLTRLRSGLGLDRLSVGSTTNRPNAPMGVEAGRYVAPGVYVGARQGAAGDSSRGVVQIDVLDHVKIEGDVGANSNGRVGVKLEWDY
jgi:translocation and assembly module TamB